MKIFCTLSFLSFTVLSALAQEPTDSVTGKELQNVVVTGQYKPQSLKNSVYQVRVITGEQIRKQSASRLQDVLNTQLNLRFSQDLATGGSNLSMMGLTGQNIKILIDGVPMVGRQGTSNEININQIDLHSIERIEIIEGPMSVIYGADALAGVINIITRKPLANSFTVRANLQEESVGREYGIKSGVHNQQLALSVSYRNWYASAGFGHNLFQGWKDTAVGRELSWHKKDQLLANAVLGYRKANLDVYYRIDGLDEIITNPANLPGNGQSAIDQDYLTDRIMQQLQGRYQFSSSLLAQVAFSTTHFTRQVYSTLYYPDGDIRVATAPGLHSLSTFNGYTFRGSVVYRVNQAISLQPGVDINIETGKGERIKTGLQQIDDYAFFLTSEIQAFKLLSLRPGLRFVRNSAYDAPPLIPSLNAKLSLNKNLDLRLAYARGFRSPSLRELYYDFFDASHSIMGNPNLKEEHSNSVTASFNWEAIHRDRLRLDWVLGGFYNDVENMIGFATSASDPTVTTYLNISRYKTRGVTLTGHLLHKGIDATAGFGYTGRYNEFSESDKNVSAFSWSPELNATLSYAVPRLGLNLNLYYKFTGKQPYYQQAIVNGQTVTEEAKMDNYQWLDLTLNKRIGKMLVLNGGVRNLLDVEAINTGAVSTGAHAAGSSSPLAYGRSVFIGLVFNFQGKLAN